MKPSTLKSKMKIKISRARREVFLRSNFEKLAGYDQVGRALRELTSEGILLKAGYGLYAKARPNRITGEPMLAAKRGFPQVAEEALFRLRASASVEAYQAGSTQIPTNAEVVISGRFNHKIETNKFKLQIVRA